MQLIFATNNRNKAEEIRVAIPDSFSIITLEEAGIHIDIPEPHASFEENAREKVQTIHRITNGNCFGEDTGLEVAALNGEPGVKSARYAGEKRSDAANIAKLLNRMSLVTERQARFRTVICLLFNDVEYYFDGLCAGTIAKEPTGSMGFGYDSIFIPTGSDKTFAEMSLTEKNAFSHRRKAVDKLVTFLTDFVINK
jgi:XTP/dITP diphosphohydrolase